MQSMLDHRPPASPVEASGYAADEIRAMRCARSTGEQRRV